MSGPSLIMGGNRSPSKSNKSKSDQTPTPRIPTFSTFPTHTTPESEESPVSHYYNSYSYLSAPTSSKINYYTTPRTRRNIGINPELISIGLPPPRQNLFPPIPGPEVKEISNLRADLALVTNQRDALAIQVEQLRMEILAGELGRLGQNSTTNKILNPDPGKMGISHSSQSYRTTGHQGQGSSAESSSAANIGENRPSPGPKVSPFSPTTTVSSAFSFGLGLCMDPRPRLSSLDDCEEFQYLSDEGQGDEIQTQSAHSVQNLQNFQNVNIVSSVKSVQNPGHYPSDIELIETQELLKMTSEIDLNLENFEDPEDIENIDLDGSTIENIDDDGDGDEDLLMMSAHLIPQNVDDHVKVTSTYSSSEMTRLSSSSSSSSASSSPVLFTQAQQSQSTHLNGQTHFHDSVEEQGDSTFGERRYGNTSGSAPARDAALVIQRAYRRYSMVKEFQRIKTERRLSRRINNNVVGSSNSPPVNSCDICIEVHPEGLHHHHNHHDLNLDHLESLEDGLETSSDLLPGQQEDQLQEVTEVDIDQTAIINANSHSQLPPHYHYHQNIQHQSHSQSHLKPSQGSKVTSRPQIQYTHPPTTYSQIQIQQNNRHHNHFHQRLPNESSRQLYPQRHIPTQSHSQSHLGQGQGQGHFQTQNGQHPHPHLPHNPNSAPGLLMVKGHLSQLNSNGSSCASGSSGSQSTTPLTNVSPNLSTSSVNSSGGGGVGGNLKDLKVVLSSEESEVIRKRLYRVGLNLFNKKPEVGVTYLVKKKFLEGSPPSVARFLVSRKGLSKQMIGEYLTNLQSPYSMSCLEHFVNEIDLSNLPVDLALRKFQSYYRMPGEAQKIERLMESFSRRYGVCNSHVVSQFRNGADTVFVLAFAIIMLNTDLHTPHLKADRRMKLEDFVKNLRSVDDGGDIDRSILTGIYDRIKSTEFKTGSDHVTQVMKVQQTIVGKKPNLAIPHRRLVCYCRLYEVPLPDKKEKAGCHQREVFLFNDLLVLTKIFHKKRNSVTYSFRQSYPLAGLTLSLFSNQYYEYGLSLKRGENVLLNLNARNEHDRAKFTEDLREAIAESDEMTRIENISKENRDRDSGVDVGKIKRFSNSLLDINDQCKPVRRGSCGSLDSGMSVSFQSDETQQNQAQQAIFIANSNNATNSHQHQGSTCSTNSSGSNSSSQISHK